MFRQRKLDRAALDRQSVPVNRTGSAASTHAGKRPAVPQAPPPPAQSHDPTTVRSAASNTAPPTTTSRPQATTTAVVNDTATVQLQQKYGTALRQRDDAWKQLREQRFRDRKAAVERDAARRAHIAAVESRYECRGGVVLLLSHSAYWGKDAKGRVHMLLSRRWNDDRDKAFQARKLRAAANRYVGDNIRIIADSHTQ